MRERQEFAFEVAQRLQRRFAQTEMWERMGVDPQAVYRTMDRVNPPAAAGVPGVAVLEDRAQLQEARPARRGRRVAAAERSPKIGVIQFEDWADTGEEYDELDEVARDRAEVA